MDLPMSSISLNDIFYFPSIVLFIICFLSSIIGVPLSIILYITFPKKIKEEFFETSPDKTVRWAWDSYMAYYAFPGMVSMVTVVKAFKKVYSNHYDFNEKLSKTRLIFFRFHFYIATTALFSGVLTGILMSIIKLLEYFPRFQES
jgi:hypothetical protein